jgi:hypothetical protein
MAAILKIVGNMNTLCGQGVEFLDAAGVGHMLNSGHLRVGTYMRSPPLLRHEKDEC